MDKHDVKVQFKIIEILSKQMLPRPQSDFTGGLYQFDIKANSKISELEKILLVVVDIDIREQHKELVLASISVGCWFEIENFDETIVKIENGYNIPSEVDILFKTVAISTVRGIMFSEFRGTYLHDALLPIVFLSQPEQDK